MQISPDAIDRMGLSRIMYWHQRAVLRSKAKNGK